MVLILTLFSVQRNSKLLSFKSVARFVFLFFYCFCVTFDENCEEDAICRLKISYEESLGLGNQVTKEKVWEKSRYLFLGSSIDRKPNQSAVSSRSAFQIVWND